MLMSAEILKSRFLDIKMINITIKTVNKVDFLKYSNLIYSDINIFHIHTFCQRRLVWDMACRACYGIKKDSLILAVNL